MREVKTRKKGGKGSNSLKRDIRTTDCARRLRPCGRHILASTKRTCIRAVWVMIVRLASGTPCELRVSIEYMRRARLRVILCDGASETRIRFQLRVAMAIVVEWRRLPRLWGGMTQRPKREWCRWTRMGEPGPSMGGLCESGGHRSSAWRPVRRRGNELAGALAW